MQVWHDNSPGNNEILYKRSTNNGSTWSVKKRLTHNAGVSGSPSIAVIGNYVHVVWHDTTPGNFDIYYKRSSNNGATWGNKKRLIKNAGGSKHPDISVSGSNVYVVWYDLTPGNYEIFFRQSSNNGATWGNKKNLTQNALGSWRPAIAASGSNVHVVWDDETSAPGGDIFYKRGP